jgi:hypothetical protein
MFDLLTRLAGLLTFLAGCACLKAIAAVIRYAYETGPGAGPAAGAAIFLACGGAAFLLVIVTPPLILAGLYALLFRLRS